MAPFTRMDNKKFMSLTLQEKLQEYRRACSSADGLRAKNNTQQYINEWLVVQRLGSNIWVLWDQIEDEVPQGQTALDVKCGGCYQGTDDVNKPCVMRCGHFQCLTCIKKGSKNEQGFYLCWCGAAIEQVALMYEPL